MILLQISEAYQKKSASLLLIRNFTQEPHFIFSNFVSINNASLKTNQHSF